MGCFVGKPRCEYTDTQWNKGAQSKSKGCLNEAALAEKNRDRQCNTCGVTKVKGEFSITQWDNSTHTKNGSKCKECCEKILADTQWVKGWKVTAASKSEAAQTPDGAADVAPEWIEKTKSEAMRWLMEAPEIALPSVNAKTYRAMMALKGRQAWTDKVQKPDDSNIPAEEKLSGRSSTQGPGGARG